MSIEYAAGLFEGEGSALMGQRAPAASIIMTDIEPLQKFLSIVGVGTIYGPYARRGRPAAKPWWAWKVSSWGEFHYVARLLWPLLSPRRRQQFERVLSNYNPKRKDLLKKFVYPR